MGYGGCGGGGHMVWATGKSERFLVGLPATEIRFATNSNCEPSGASSHATLTSQKNGSGGARYALSPANLNQVNGLPFAGGHSLLHRMPAPLRSTTLPWRKASLISRICAARNGINRSDHWKAAAFARRIHVHKAQVTAIVKTRPDVYRRFL